MIPKNTKPHLFDYVMWRSRKHIVTNGFVAGGKKIQISPVGNGNSPAKYFTVYPDEVTVLSNL